MRITPASIVCLNEANKDDATIRRGEQHWNHWAQIIESWTMIMCVMCVKDALCVFSHHGVTPWILGSTGSYTYGDVAGDQANWKEQWLEWTEYVKWLKKVKVLLNWS
jgi:hypothetical protein